MGKRAFKRPSRANLAQLTRRLTPTRRKKQADSDTDNQHQSQTPPSPPKPTFKRSMLSLNTPTIIVVGVIVAGAGVIVMENLPGASNGTQALPRDNGEPLTLLPSDDVLEELFSATEAGQAAAENALSFYKDRATPRLATFSKDELHALLGADDTEVVDDGPRDIDEIEVLTDGEDGDIDDSATPLTDTLSDSISALRQFGGYGTGNLRPAALTSSAQVANMYQRYTQYREMTAEEIQARQDAFRESSLFTTLITKIGTRVGAHWAPPRVRYIPDGAVVELNLTPDGDLIDAEIQRSTGRPLYDQSVINAARAAAPYQEIEALDPWLIPVLSNVRLTFGKPPITPEETERRRAAGTLRSDNPSEADLESIQALFDGGDQADFFGMVREQIENEWISRNPSRFSPERDAEIVVNLSVPLGVVLGMDVVRSSRDLDFDRAAINAIDASGPFRGMRNLISVEQERMSHIKLHFHEHGIR